MLLISPTRWALSHGAIIAGSAAGVGGLIFDLMYRKKFNVATTKRFSTLIPNMVLPFISTFLGTATFIQVPMILGHVKCPTCLQVRASCLQVGFGWAFPLALAPVSSAMLAKLSHSYAFSQEYTVKEVLKIWTKTSPRLKNTILMMFCFQASLATVLTHQQGKSLVRLMGVNQREELSEGRTQYGDNIEVMKE